MYYLLHLSTIYYIYLLSITSMHYLLHLSTIYYIYLLHLSIIYNINYLVIIHWALKIVRYQNCKMLNPNRGWKDFNDSNGAAITLITIQTILMMCDAFTKAKLTFYFNGMKSFPFSACLLLPFFCGCVCMLNYHKNIFSFRTPKLFCTSLDLFSTCFVFLIITQNSR